MVTSQNNTRVRVPNSQTPSLDTATSQEVNDVVSPNPPTGRDITDCSIGVRTCLLICKKQITASTLNVKTLRESYKREELAVNLIDKNIGILDIQEHRIIHQETICYENLLGRKLITSSAWRNDCGVARGGVATKSLSKVESRSNRILIIHFTGSPKTTVIVTYSPTNVPIDEDIQLYYESLRRAIKSVPAHNFLIILGNFNAQLGLDDAGYTMHTTSNRNGKLFHDLAVEKNLIIGNTSFQKGLGKLWIYIGPGGYKSQKDYIIIQKKRRNSLLNAESCNSFSSIGSHHRFLSARIRQSLHANGKILPKHEKLDWSAVSIDPNMQENYSIEVRKRYTALAKDKHSATEKYANFSKVNNEVASELIPSFKVKENTIL